MGTRANNTLRNARYALLCQALGTVATFVTRAVFAAMLGAEYLGIEGLFSNMVTLLSVSELGIGSAITFALYRPLAENDEPAVKSLMRAFKLAYRAIGAGIILLGAVMALNIGFFAPGTSFETGTLGVYFMLFVLASGLSYFYSYKRVLIIADQKRYVATAYRYGFYCALCLFQIVALLFTRSYVLYLALMVVFNVAENVFVSRKADRLYPYLKDRRIEPLDPSVSSTLKRNIAALTMHKMGGVVLAGTDSIVISKVIGVVFAGLYSNYCLMANGVNTVFGVLVDSVTASIGNFGATERIERRIDLFRTIDLLVFALYATTSLALAFCANPFIALWLGDEYLLSPLFVGLFAISFYVQGMRRSVWACKDPFGLFWPDRFRPLVEVVANIGCSIALAHLIGLPGVVLGTIVATVGVDAWWEALVLFRTGLGTSPWPYYLSYAKRLASIVALVALGLWAKTLLGVGPAVELVACLAASLALGALLVALPYRGTAELSALRACCARFLEGRRGRA